MRPFVITGSSMNTRFLIDVGFGAAFALLLGARTEEHVALIARDGASRAQLVAEERYEDRAVMFAPTSSEKMTSRSL